MKRKVVRLTSSSIYQDIRPSAEGFLRRQLESCGGESHIFPWAQRMGLGSPDSQRWVISSVFGEGKLAKAQERPDSVFVETSSVCEITISEALALLAKVNEYLLTTEAGMSKFLEKNFSAQAKVSRGGLEMGQIRIFSDDLICFYDGKNWRRVTLAPEEII